jgi:hypothetical protein
LPIRPTPYALLPLIIIATLWGWAFWKWPVKTFSLLPFVLPFYLLRTKIGPLPTTLLELIVIATFVAWLFRPTTYDLRFTISFTDRFHHLLNISKTWILPVGLWLVAGFIGIFVAQNHIAALGLYRAYFIEPILIFIIGLDLMNRDRRSKIGDHNTSDLRPTTYDLRSSLAWVLILLGIYAIVQFVTGWGIPYPWHDLAGRRAVGPFPYPNALSLFVAPVTVLLFAEWLKMMGTLSKTTTTRSITSTMALMGVAGGLTSILLAKSDGGFIAVCAGIFVACLFYKRIRWIAVSLAIAGLIGIAAISPIRTKVLHVVEFKEWSGMVRTVIWKESVAMLKDHPIFGAGLGGYPDAIKPYHKATWMEIFQFPHNIVLNLWSETGLLGIVAFGWILVAWAQGAGRRALDKTAGNMGTPAAYPYVIPVITAIVVHGLVDVPYFKNDLSIMFWLLILVTIYPSRPKTSTTSL